MLEEAGYPDGLDVDLHIVTDFQPIVPIMALPVQEYLEAVGHPHHNQGVPELGVLPHGAHIRITGHVLVLHEHHCRAGNGNRFWRHRERLLRRQRVPGNARSKNCTRPRIRPSIRGERARLLAELYITFYDNYSWLFLTEVSAATMTAANVNWPVGSAELRGEGTLSAIQKLKT